MKKMDELLKDSWLSAVDASYLTQVQSSIKAVEKQGSTTGLGDLYLNEKPLDIQRHTRVNNTVYKDDLLLICDNILQKFRRDGHLYAQIDPLNERSQKLSVSIESLERVPDKFAEQPYFSGLLAADWIKNLQKMYCGCLSIEASHLEESEQQWSYRLFDELSTNSCPKPLMQEFYQRLAAAEGLEKALASKFPGAKRFSLEGLDSFIILLEQLLRESALSCGVEEVTLGLSHRGRLNVMVNILGKKPVDLFKEFSGEHHVPSDYSGDVKYHQGFSTTLHFEGCDLHVALSFNPSHLEIVGPVIQGSTKARQDQISSEKPEKVLPIIIHGDAALSGQGVVMEVLNMSRTPDYGVAGTIHIVLNNQIGFTTSKNEEARSTRYCTDIAKMIGAPVLHVNADDPIAVWRAALWAARWRAKWRQDVFINLVGYRRLGHNEADEPSVTQPQMYAIISQKPTALTLWGRYLEAEGVLSKDSQTTIRTQYRSNLEEGGVIAPYYQERVMPRFFDWAPFMGKNLKKSTVPTAVPLKKLQDIGKAIVGSVVSMTLHPRVAKIYQARQKMYLGAERLDWGAAELLAYGSLLSEGFSLRLAGQDSQRGTFFHRHAVVCDQKTGAQKNTLSALCLPDKHCSIINSLLSEMAAMGFEYGYAMTDPQTLVIWEAQFGDFCNGAQVVIDQFISSGEKKWQRLSAITLFLPHGYEGQGPEHSSARIERFLQLAAQDNMRVVYPSTAAQMFHLLRSQIKATHRHPLIVFTPKSLLRLPAATSSLEEIATGSFQEILYDNNHQKPIRTIILCTGKIYYELLELQQKNKHDSALLVRIEQLYPFPKEALSELLTEYHLVHDIRWVQEEPANQGAWFFVSPLLREITPHQVQYRGRDAMAAPAVGSSHEHDKEQLAILEAAFS